VANSLVNPPYSVNVADERGLLTGPWIAFFRSLYIRVGSQQALNNVELATLQTASIATLQTSITALTAQVATLSTQVTTGLQALGQGPVL
jgi:hypothetical protein